MNLLINRYSSLPTVYISLLIVSVLVANRLEMLQRIHAFEGKDTEEMSSGGFNLVFRDLIFSLRFFRASMLKVFYVA